MDSFSEKFHEASFAKIAYLHFPNPGPAIVFIHGNSTCKEIFEKQYQTLNSKFHLLVFDLPGHGSSSNTKILPEKCYTVPNYARCLKELLDFLQIPKILIMGSSLGGHIGLD
jgi:pimeloyl-ACP methyl ester carboxylesterase